MLEALQLIVCCLQEEIEDGIRHLEDATRMATELSLFSRNEQLDEVATNDLK